MFTSMSTTALSIVLLCALFAQHEVHAHALMTTPRQRGALKCDESITMVPTLDEDAPADFKAHFPAGDKSESPGAGKNSQLEAGGGTYEPFAPFDPNFKWRAGVCGDEVDGGEHLKGGEFYGDGKIVETYQPGEVVDFASTSVGTYFMLTLLFLMDMPLSSLSVTFIAPS